jgi:hypothetical protein
MSSVIAGGAKRARLGGGRNRLNYGFTEKTAESENKQA